MAYGKDVAITLGIGMNTMSITVDRFIAIISADSSIVRMEYTDTNDKNNTKIFTGDIIDAYLPHQIPGVQFVSKALKKCIVVFESGSYCLVTLDSLKQSNDQAVCIPFPGMPIQDVEVVGNIFEHSHLIS